jgi:hypothetical protein
VVVTHGECVALFVFTPDPKTYTTHRSCVEFRPPKNKGESTGPSRHTLQVADMRRRTSGCFQMTQPRVHG